MYGTDHITDRTRFRDPPIFHLTTPRVPDIDESGTTIPAVWLPGSTELGPIQNIAISLLAFQTQNIDIRICSCLFGGASGSTNGIDDDEDDEPGAGADGRSAWPDDEPCEVTTVIDGDDMKKSIQDYQVGNNKKKRITATTTQGR